MLLFGQPVRFETEARVQHSSFEERQAKNVVEMFVVGGRLEAPHFGAASCDESRTWTIPTVTISCGSYCRGSVIRLDRFVRFVRFARFVNGCGGLVAHSFSSSES